LNQKRTNRISLLITAIIQLVLVAILYLFTAWQAPDPPLPVYGVELDISLESTSSLPAQTSIQRIEPDLPDESNSELPETVKESNTEEVSEADEETDISEENPIEEDVEEIIDEPIEEEVTANNAEVIPTPEETKQDETQLDSTVTSNVTQESDNSEVMEQSDPQPIIDERALFSANQGNQDHTDQSFVLDIAGFELSEAPIINDQSNETGRVKIRISVGDDGYAVPLEIIESTVSLSIANLYRDAIEQLYFEQTSPSVPPQTTGIITFIIKAN
jgi:protein TonB